VWTHRGESTLAKLETTGLVVVTELDAHASAVAHYQSWLGASRDRTPLDNAVMGTHQRLGLAQNG